MAVSSLWVVAEVNARPVDGSAPVAADGQDGIDGRGSRERSGSPAVDADGGEGPVTAGGGATTPGPVPAIDEPDPADPTDPAAVEVAATGVFARYGMVVLHLPSTPRVVGFHESSNAFAFAMSPAGRLVEDRNPTRTSLPRDEDTGTDYLVLTSRGRRPAPTSSVDIVVTHGEAVLAPVTGIVSDVRDYALYGRHRDLRVEVIPDADPTSRVVVIHIEDVLVEAGDRVVGGITPVAASARLLPFASHIDRETEPERLPHVHIEVQPVDARRPGDPDPTETADDPADGVAA